MNYALQDYTIDLQETLLPKQPQSDNPVYYIRIRLGQAHANNASALVSRFMYWKNAEFHGLIYHTQLESFKTEAAENRKIDILTANTPMATGGNTNFVRVLFSPQLILNKIKTDPQFKWGDAKKLYILLNKGMDELLAQVKFDNETHEVGHLFKSQNRSQHLLLGLDQKIVAGSVGFYIPSAQDSYWEKNGKRYQDTVGALLDAHHSYQAQTGYALFDSHIHALTNKNSKFHTSNLSFQLSFLYEPGSYDMAFEYSKQAVSNVVNKSSILKSDIIHHQVIDNMGMALFMQHGLKDKAGIDWHYLKSINCDLNARDTESVLQALETCYLYHHMEQQVKSRHTAQTAKKNKL